MKKRTLFIACIAIYCTIAFGKATRNNSAAAKNKQAATESLCLDLASNSIIMRDFKPYTLLTNYISKQQYIYWKKQQQLSLVTIDSNLVRSIYLDFLKDTTGYSDYMAVAGESQFKPKVVYLCPYDDSTVLGYLLTYTSDTIAEKGQLTVAYTQVPSILEITQNQSAKIFYINKRLPLPSYYLGQELFSYKKDVYIDLSSEEQTVLQRGEDIKLLARLKRKQSVYSVDRFEPESMHPYLIANKIFTHYNRYYQDNGYLLMSLSNYILNLETRKKIMLPLDDSIFNKLDISPSTYAIDYGAFDLKFNVVENKFYILYNLNGKVFVASFQPRTTAFEQNMLLYPFKSEFGGSIRSLCLSWDAKKLLYRLKGDPCIYTVDFAELQQLAKDYKKPAVSSESK